MESHRLSAAVTCLAIATGAAGVSAVTHELDRRDRMDAAESFLPGNPDWYDHFADQAEAFKEERDESLLHGALTLVLGSVAAAHLRRTRAPK